MEKRVRTRTGKNRPRLRALSRSAALTGIWPDRQQLPAAYPTRNASHVHAYEQEYKDKLSTRLANIRNNYLHQTTTSIVKTKPYRVVIEDLNVKGMMKNKHLSDAIRKQGFYEFKRQLEYKCKFRGIELVVADRFYPSSKTCSQCGKVKKDLKLKDRVYKCSCGLSIDRDLNASINLSRYKLA